MGLDQQAVDMSLLQFEAGPVHGGQILLQPSHHVLKTIGACQAQHGLGLAISNKPCAGSRRCARQVAPPVHRLEGPNRWDARVRSTSGPQPG
jgi:hypothetical protein